MIKRVIAVTAALVMLWASTQIEQPQEGEPVARQATKTAEATPETKAPVITPVEVREKITPVEPEENEVIYDGTVLSRFEIENSQFDGRYALSAEADETARELDAVDTVEYDGAGEDNTSVGEVNEIEGVIDDGYTDEVTADGSADDEGLAEPVIDETEVIEDTAPDYEYLGDWTISFYCSCSACCGSWAGGPTASGAMPSAWWTVATGDLPFGTILYVDGLGTFEVQDRGTGYGWLDVFVSDHSEAQSLGLMTRAVYIVR